MACAESVNKPFGNLHHSMRTVEVVVDEKNANSYELEFR